MKKPFSWVLLHSTLILVAVISLLSGLRIATLSYPQLLTVSALLPQGLMHRWHLTSAAFFSAIVIGYVFYLALFRRAARRQWRHRDAYHRAVEWFGYSTIAGLLCTGVGLYFFSQPFWKTLHFVAALLLLIYILLHAIIYLLQYGINILPAIVNFSSVALSKNIMVSVAFLGIAGSFYFLYLQRNFYSLPVAQVETDEFFEIDGIADEAGWQNAVTVSVPTFGGANFIDGATSVRIKAVTHHEDIFFHITWQDPTQSLAHLPLIKTEQGWRIIQDGFHHFNERSHYEDKFAVILADTCEPGAAGTAHLGHKPLKDKPAHWTGKGYHYAGAGQMVDLWHWKAVRTNDMFLADDNFIGEPDIARPGSRRYTGGYMPDGKDSGSYVMNWDWYKADRVIPKRLPKNPAELAGYDLQKNSSTLNWVIPWFSYEPYSETKDTYPVGTIMPSVIYTSNQFEGDRADVRARAQWSDGIWSLEMARKLDTGSPNDILIKDGICLWVAAFDHAQIEHTRHVRPIKLVLKR